MKKIANIYILIGLLCFITIIVISAISETNIISAEVETIGFIILGYIGVIFFTYGWLKRFKANKWGQKNEN